MAERAGPVLERFVEQACGGAVDDDLLLVTRIVDKGGRTRVRLGGRPATLSALRELGGMLLEIHGQGDSRALMRPEIQCETLDAFAGTAQLRGAFAAALESARELRARIARGASVRYLMPDAVLDYVRKHHLYGEAD